MNFDRWIPPMSETARHPGGRPSTYTPELADQYLTRLAEGELTVEISAESGMPSRATIFRWREAHPEFRNAYARAREMQAQACAEKAVLAGRKATPEDAAAARVRFDADRWLAARLDPNNYCERVQTQQLGKNGDPIDTLRVEVVLKG
jgi:hypothetical protein